MSLTIYDDPELMLVQDQAYLAMVDGSMLSYRFTDPSGCDHGWFEQHEGLIVVDMVVDQY